MVIRQAVIDAIARIELCLTGDGFVNELNQFGELLILGANFGVEVPLTLKNDELAVRLRCQELGVFERAVRVIIGMDKNEFATVLFDLFEIERPIEKLGQIIPAEVILESADQYSRPDMGLCR